MSYVESCDLNPICCVWVIQIYIFVGCRMPSWLAYQQSEEMSGLQTTLVYFPRYSNYSNISTFPSAQFPQTITWSVENTDSNNGALSRLKLLTVKLCRPASCHTQATHNPTMQAHSFYCVPSAAFRISAEPNMTSDDEVTASDNMLLQLYTDWLVLRCPGHWWRHHQFRYCSYF
jgi:hypothetical protein